MKKTAIILLCFIMMTQFVFGAVATAETDADVIEKAEFLKTIGVMTAYPANYDAYVSRAEFSLYAARIINVSEYGAADRRLFIDIPMDHWAVFAINGLVDRGVLSSDPEGKFRPDDAITTEEAVKVIMCALGYKPYAEAYGGFPSGYMKVARQTGVISAGNLGTNVTYSDAVEMIYEALSTEILEGESYSGEDISYTHYEGNTPLSVYRDIHSTEGVVTAADGVLLNSDYYADFGEIQVNGVTYECDCDPFEYLGRYVTLYYEQKSDEKGKTVFIFTDKNDNKSVEFDAEDFISYDSATGKVMYYGEDYDDESITASPELSVVKNGDSITENIENTIKNVAKGKYLFVDGDSDGRYELLIISEYQNVVVNYVDSVNGKIYDKYNAGYPIDVLGTDSKKVLIYKDSLAAALTDIAAGNVLTVYESKNYIRIYVSTNSVAGKIAEVRKSDDATKVSIADTWYEVDSDFATKTGISIRTGMEGTFATDIFGKIAHIVSDGLGAAYTCGYVIDYTVRDGFSSEVVIKVYVPTVGIKEYTLADKTRIDGISEDNTDEKINLLNKCGNIKGEVIFFGETEGKINRIDTPNYNSKEEEMYSLRSNRKETAVRYRQKKFGKTIIANDSTVVIGVPSDENLKTAKEFDFCTPALGNVSINTDYAVNSYKFDLESGFDDVVVIKNFASSAPSTELVVVNEVSSAYRDEEVVEKLTYYKAGVLGEVYVDGDKSMMEEEIKQGDVLRIGTDAKGDVASWKVIFSYKANALPSDVNEVNYGSSFNTTDRVIFGYAQSINDGVLKLYRDKNKPEEIDEVFNVREVGITLYDSAAVKNEYRISSGNYNEITTQDTTGTPAMVIVRTNLAQIKDVIVFK